MHSRIIPNPCKRAKGDSTTNNAYPSLLFDHWDEISHCIQRAGNVRLFLDFDGTLVDICLHPDQVRVDRRTKAALRKLAAHRSISLAIVSGRRRSILRNYIKIPRIRLWGLYGWENGVQGRMSRKAVSQLSLARDRLTGLHRKVPGIFVEDKGVGIAVHFRGASAAARRRAQVRVRDAVKGMHHNLRIIRSIKAWEVVPRRVGGKGDVVRRATAKSRSAFLPIYLGDDLTDEPAFSVLGGNPCRAITVLVGPKRKTHARFRLRNPGEVREFLGRLEKELT